jgi:hypothetical protein
MKITFIRNLLFITTACCAYFFLNSCSKDKVHTETHTETYTYTYTINTPVYRSKSDIFKSINGPANTAIEHAGKIYTKDDFIYLNEVNKGIHIIDNSNPSYPVQVAFLSIPGNLDIAIKGNILYADMYTDLLALDITDVHHAEYKTSIPNFFTGRIYPFTDNSYSYFQPSTTNDMVAVDWIVKDTTVTYTNTYTDCNDCEYLANTSTAPGIKSGNNTGVAGSMAGMVLMNNYLYAISEMHSLGIVDVSNASHPKLDSSFFAGFDLETIYPLEDKLFLGSAIGVFMYDVSNPEQPVSIGNFEHGTACDPVIADSNYAYVTLHSGSACGGDKNELDVVNVQDLANSKLVKTYNLSKPTGLSKDGDLLFVCDDTNIKVYNAANPAGLVLLQQITSNKPYDVIAANKKLIVVDDNGISQYDYSNIRNIRMLSFIAAKK